MKGFTKLLVATVLVSGAASATKVPIPIDGATLNVSFQLQPWFLIQENGIPSSTTGTVATPGTGDPSYELFIRRSRVLVNGDANQNFSYLVQFDNANFGRRGDYNVRAIIQDAWVGWAPTGITGPNVLYIDAGILLVPFSHQGLVTTTNFITADVHTDSLRIGRGNSSVPGLRDIGVQLRGWALDKKIGFRGGIYEGQRGFAPTQLSGTQGTCTPVPATPTTPATFNCGAAVNPNAGLNPHSVPRLAGFVNFDLLGSEEGAWLYQENYWATAPILSVGFATVYQRDAVKGPTGVTEQMLNSLDVFLDYPLSEKTEITFEATAHRSNNGRASSDTGWGGWADLGVRVGNWKPYVSYEFFTADACPDGYDAFCTGTFGGGSAGRAVYKGADGTSIGTNDSRIVKVGLNYFIDRNRNHINAEFALNRGQSSIAPPSQSSNIGLTATKTFLLHYNFIF